MLNVHKILIIKINTTSHLEPHLEPRKVKILKIFKKLIYSFISSNKKNICKLNDKDCYLSEEMCATWREYRRGRRSLIGYKSEIGVRIRFSSILIGCFIVVLLPPSDKGIKKGQILITLAIKLFSMKIEAYLSDDENPTPF